MGTEPAARAGALTGNPTGTWRADARPLSHTRRRSPTPCPERPPILPPRPGWASPLAWGIRGRRDTAPRPPSLSGHTRPPSACCAPRPGGKWPLTEGPGRRCPLRVQRKGLGTQFPPSTPRASSSPHPLPQQPPEPRNHQPQRRRTPTHRVSTWKDLVPQDRRGDLSPGDSGPAVTSTLPRDRGGLGPRQGGLGHLAGGTARGTRAQVLRVPQDGASADPRTPAASVSLGKLRLERGRPRPGPSGL